MITMFRGRGVWGGLTAVAAGALAAGTLCACSAPDPIDAYLADVRHSAAIPAQSTDGQILLMGAFVCGFSADGNTFAPAVQQAAASEPFVATTRKYCGTVFAQPLTPEQRTRYGLDQVATTLGATPSVAAPVTADKVSIGERFNVIGADHTALGSAAITAIEVDPSCKGAARYTTTPPKPTNGHFIAVQLDVATTAQYDPTAFSYPTGYDFTVTGPDGYTSGQVYSGDLCIADREGFTTPMVASSKYRGWVLLDSPTATGTLTFRPHFAPTTYAGVTIDLPASGAVSASAEPSVTESADDYAQMRADIAAHGGQASNSAESQYLYACQQKTLPPADCP